MKKKRGMSLGQKSTLLIVIFAVVLGGATIIMGYTAYSTGADREVEAVGNDILSIASEFIDGDAVKRYEETLEPDEEYYEIDVMLHKLMVDDRMMYIFVFKPTEAGQLYLFDTDDTKEGHFALGYVDPWYSEFEEYVPLFMEGADIEPLISDEEFGWIMTEYKQIYDSSGNFVAYVGADLSMDSIMHEKQQFLVSLVVLTAILTFGFSLLYLYYIRKVIVKPINKIAKAADAYLVQDTLGGGESSFSASLDNDYISLDELGSLARSLRSMEMKINEYIQNLDVANQKAEKDGLTGLFNREAFYLRVNSILSGDMDKTQWHAFMMIDLDNFKTINDTYGHVTGDEVLIKFANTLKHLVRGSDVVARVGGDEFAIFLNSVGNLDRIKSKANELKEAVEQLKVEESSEGHLSMSMGIAICPIDGTTAGELYESADMALYTVKSLGKGNFKFAQDIARKTHMDSENGVL